MVLIRFFLLLLLTLNMHASTRIRTDESVIATASICIRIDEGETASVDQRFSRNVSLVGKGTCIFTSYIFEAIDKRGTIEQQREETGIFCLDIESGFAIDRNNQRFSSGRHLMRYYLDANRAAPRQTILQAGLHQTPNMVQHSKNISENFCLKPSPRKLPHQDTQPPYHTNPLRPGADFTQAEYDQANELLQKIW
jgi:hypothetical protein